jgi:N-acyl-phosphatidylethanolamine-hydrolysing phospholipase D
MGPDDERPAHHVNDSATSFQNPWVKPKSLLASGQVLSQFPLAFARRLEDHPAKPVQVVRPDFGGDVPSSDALRATWLGHAVRLYTASMLRCLTFKRVRASW